MAMYYYASKISAIACGARCKKNMFKKARGQRDRDKSDSQCKATMDLDMDQIQDFDQEHCVDSIDHYTIISQDFLKSNRELINFLLPTSNQKINKDLVFSVLLSTRFFIKPHDLMGVLLSNVPELENMDSLIDLLKLWTEMFPYDFRDERIMNHVKHIASKFSNTSLENLISEVLSALLICLTDLENHEKELRNYMTNKNKENLSNTSIDKKSSNYAKILYRIDHRLARYIGPENSLNSNVLPNKSLVFQDSKRTCNLETYVSWSCELRLFICNDILMHEQLESRSEALHFWIEVAQISFNLENYNTTVIILESLESPPIKRLKKTWEKLTLTYPQLDCMHQDTKVYVRDYKLNFKNFSLIDDKIHDSNVHKRHEKNSVIPYFTDILKLALASREQCLIR
uniref:Ras-GEF domain-containing protein n=1 Tax=Megaselia scalaris TaxID=36166 RepID=T1GJ49_MEGSC